MTKIAIIPARGGSKRIPKKNCKHFLGKPVIAYSIETALASELFDEVMVSTDDETIASIAKKYGAKVPFLRTKKNANDFATLVDVMLEVINDYNKLGKSFEHLCCILPTAPFVTIEKLAQGYNMLVNQNFESVLPIVEFSYPIQRALEIKTNKVKMVKVEFEKTRSQDLEKRYHDTGQFYWIKNASLLKHQKLFTDNSGAMVISELEVQDIDTENDWMLAELKYKLMRNDKNYNL